MTASKRGIGSDLAKVDAYENTAADYEELPELTDEQMAGGVLHRDGVPARMGRPPIGETSKKQITIRLDPKVIEAYKATGPGWQAKMNDYLAGQAVVAALVEGYEASATAMRKLLGMFHSGALAMPLKKARGVGSIDSIERQIAITDEAAKGVRKILNDQALKELAR